MVYGGQSLQGSLISPKHHLSALHGDEWVDTQSSSRHTAEELLRHPTRPLTKLEHVQHLNLHAPKHDSGWVCYSNCISQLNSSDIS